MKLEIILASLITGKSGRNVPLNILWQSHLPLNVWTSFLQSFPALFAPSPFSHPLDKNRMTLGESKVSQDCSKTSQCSSSLNSLECVLSGRGCIPAVLIPRDVRHSPQGALLHAGHANGILGMKNTQRKGPEQQSPAQKGISVHPTWGWAVCKSLLTQMLHKQTSFQPCSNFSLRTA